MLCRILDLNNSSRFIEYSRHMWVRMFLVYLEINFKWLKDCNLTYYYVEINIMLILYRVLIEFYQISCNLISGQGKSTWHISSIDVKWYKSLNISVSLLVPISNAYQQSSENIFLWWNLNPGVRLWNWVTLAWISQWVSVCPRW